MRPGESAAPLVVESHLAAATGRRDRAATDRLGNGAVAQVEASVGACPIKCKASKTTGGTVQVRQVQRERGQRISSLSVFDNPSAIIGGEAPASEEEKRRVELPETLSRYRKAISDHQQLEPANFSTTTRRTAKRSHWKGLDAHTSATRSILQRIGFCCSS